MSAGLPRVFLLALCLVVPALAQLSPGKLARPHQSLEGLTRCTQCHELGKPVDGARCLACHTSLADRIKAGAGYHASSRLRSRTCVSCHSDHHGLSFQMIFWEEGDGAFSHRETGWALEGAHARAKCRACHRAELLDSAVARRKDINSGRTFLGLQTACLSCHRDEHQGQLDSNCAACHDARSWDQPRFDHDTARFALTGAHARAACAACHKPELPRTKDARLVVEGKPAQAVARFRPMAYSRCTDCHTDPHENRLGAECASCHTTASFTTREGGFDHGKTRYPLTGAHEGVACDKCHKGPQPGRQRPEFRECNSCHRDPHDGQFSRAGSSRPCSSCHETNRFKPSEFGLARHQEGSAPLHGAHLAVACGDCHTRRTPKEPLRFDLGGRAFSGDACATCHRDPHDGQAQPWMRVDGCLDCHGLDSWSGIGFDHGRTDFVLTGAHERVACGMCHKTAAALKGGPVSVPLKGLAKECAACHADPHRDQFTERSGTSDCARCHVGNAWNDSRLDHGLTRFPLDGQHRDLACSACHGLERDEVGEFRRYKPLGVRCEDCHSVSTGD